jgi:hypothetical protein
VLECQVEKWREIVRVFLRGPSAADTPPSTQVSRPTSAEPRSHSLSRTGFRIFAFPSTGPVAGSTIRRRCVTASQRKTSGAAVVCHQSYANFQGKSGTILQGTPCFTISIWSNHFYHLELSASTPSLLYHAIFAMRPLGHVLTANFRASSKSNRPIPNAMGRK